MVIAYWSVPDTVLAMDIVYWSVSGTAVDIVLERSENLKEYLLVIVADIVARIAFDTLAGIALKTGIVD